jgi:hypothetical protein
MPGRKLEGNIKQLHNRQSDDHVGRNFHPSAGFADAPYNFSHVRGRLHKFPGKFVEVIGGAAQLVQNARGINQRGRCPLAVTQIKLGLAGGPSYMRCRISSAERERRSCTSAWTVSLVLGSRVGVAIVGLEPFHDRTHR